MPYLCYCVYYTDSSRALAFALSYYILQVGSGNLFRPSRRYSTLFDINCTCVEAKILDASGLLASLTPHLHPVTTFHLLLRLVEDLTSQDCIESRMQKTKLISGFGLDSAMVLLYRYTARLVQSWPSCPSSIEHQQHCSRGRWPVQR